MMAMPIPFALSLVIIELKNAKAVKITVIKQPLISIIMPMLSGALINSGIPAPTKKAKIIEKERPRNKLIQIFPRLMGWLNSSSINSALLYK
ncbi:hypothetical protein FLLO111716_00915 [Flavobacterium longum]